METDLEPYLERVLSVLTTEPLSFDRIAQECRLEGAIVGGALLQLELKGLAAQVPGKRFVKC
jgi:DNA processing protein